MAVTDQDIVNLIKNFDIRKIAELTKVSRAFVLKLKAGSPADPGSILAPFMADPEFHLITLVHKPDEGNIYCLICPTNRCAQISAAAPYVWG